MLLMSKYNSKWTHKRENARIHTHIHIYVCSTHMSDESVMRHHEREQNTPKVTKEKSLDNGIPMYVKM